MSGQTFCSCARILQIIFQCYSCNFCCICELQKSKTTIVNEIYLHSSVSYSDISRNVKDGALRQCIIIHTKFVCLSSRWSSVHSLATLMWYNPAATPVRRRSKGKQLSVSRCWLHTGALPGLTRPYSKGAQTFAKLLAFILCSNELFFFIDRYISISNTFSDLKKCKIITI